MRTYLKPYDMASSKQQLERPPHPHMHLVFCLSKTDVTTFILPVFLIVFFLLIPNIDPVIVMACFSMLMHRRGRRLERPSNCNNCAEVNNARRTHNLIDTTPDFGVAEALFVVENIGKRCEARRGWWK